MYANKIIVTKHAKKRYIDRVDQSVSDKEIEENLIDVFLNGKSKKIRKSILEKNALEFIITNGDVFILAIIKQKINKFGKKYKEGVIVTCLGDELMRMWHQKQIKKKRKVYSSR